MLIWVGALMGLGGTLAMDVWAQALHRLAGYPLPKWALVGRWTGHLSARIFHDDITTSQPVKSELQLGWLTHYGVGVIYGIIFAVIAGADWFAAPTFGPVLLFSLLTIFAGWFLLQPGLGLGWAASKQENRWEIRCMGLLAHTVFALGMFTVAVVAL